MPLTIPPGVDAEGRRNMIFSPTSTPSVATLSGATAVELTCYLTKGSFGASAETERGTDERECTTQVFEVLGKTTWSLNALDYVWDPQAAAADPNNKAYETLAPGTSGFIFVRHGVDADDPLTVGEKVWIFPVTVGAQVPKAPEGNAAEKLKITQEVVVTGNVEVDVLLAA